MSPRRPAPPVCLTVAGSDPSGGAGLQADLKTFHGHGAYGASAVTLITVQDTRGVTAVELLDPDLVEAQVRTVLEDLAPAAIKTGALGAPGIVERVAGVLAPYLAERPAAALVVDPVLVSKHGDDLATRETAAALVERLLPLARCVTPNAHELARLAGGGDAAPATDEDEASRLEAARALAARGPAVFAKSPPGGVDGRSVDLLVEGSDVLRLEAPRIDTTSLHGSGCATAAAITARLALGDDLAGAVRTAKAWVTRAIEDAPGLGHGTGPLDLLAPAEEPA